MITTLSPNRFTFADLDSDAGADIDFLNRRYTLMFHFRTNEPIHYTLIDMTRNLASRLAWTGTLAGSTWTGSSQLTAHTYEVSKGTQTTGIAEIGEVSKCRRAWITGVDSLASSATFGLTPLFATHNNVAAMFTGGQQQLMIQRCATRLKAEALAAGLGRFNLECAGARSGHKLAEFADNLAGHLADSRGIGIVMIDAGIVNTAVTVTAANFDATLFAARQDIYAIAQILVTKGNAFWMTTGINRPAGGLNAIQNQFVDEFNTIARSVVQQWASANTFCSDPARAIDDHSALFTAGNDIHFNAAGNETYARSMLEDMVCAVQGNNGGGGNNGKSNYYNWWRQPIRAREAFVERRNARRANRGI